MRALRSLFRRPVPTIRLDATVDEYGSKVIAVTIPNRRGGQHVIMTDPSGQAMMFYTEQIIHITFVGPMMTEVQEVPQ